MADSQTHNPAPIVDRALARQLEHAEGMANAAFVDARASMQPGVGAQWIDVAGVRAMHDGAESPLTQTFGLGLDAPFRSAEFDAIEAFFTAHGASTAHEVSAFAAPETIALLGARGYVPLEASVVHVRPTNLPMTEPAQHTLAVRAIAAGEELLWSQTARDGWASEAPELGEFLEQLGVVIAKARGATCFIAERDGVPIATAALNISNGVALMAGAATVPSGRRQGAQRALLDARLAFAAAQGVERAMVVTQPGSGSQRNALRNGFVPVYTRAKWVRMLG